MMNEVTYHQLPQPDEISEREKEDAMGAYLMMFASIGAGLPLPIINMIAAIIYYYLNRSKSLFVKFHALQSLLSQFPTSIMNAAAVIWSFRILITEMEFSDLWKGYLIMVVVANLIYFIFSIVAAVKARKGRFYYFLFFGKLTYDHVYRVRAEAEDMSTVNQPPKI